MTATHFQNPLRRQRRLNLLLTEDEYSFLTREAEDRETDRNKLVRTALGAYFAATSVQPQDAE